MSLRKSKNSPEWIAKQKNKPTKQKHLDEIVKTYALTKDERTVLWEMCRRPGVPNILYLVHDEKNLDNLFREYYAELAETGDEQLISTFFALKLKFERAQAAAAAINSSKSIPNGTILTYITPDLRRYIFPLLKNAAEGLYLQIPHALSLPTGKPMALTKVKLLFTLPSGVNYEMNTRILRYQTGFSGLAEMVVTHSTDIKAHTERHAKRYTINQKIVFSAVKITAQKTETGENIQYEPLEHRYPGMMIDISGGGCKLVSKLPIKKDQHIWLEFQVTDEQVEHAIGLIVKTNRNPYANEFNLHIKFIKISQDAQNRILARVYEYAV